MQKHMHGDTFDLRSQAIVLDVPDPIISKEKLKIGAFGMQPNSQTLRISGVRAQQGCNRVPNQNLRNVIKQPKSLKSALTKCLYVYWATCYTLRCHWSQNSISNAGSLGFLVLHRHPREEGHFFTNHKLAQRASGFRYPRHLREEGHSFPNHVLAWKASGFRYPLYSHSRIPSLCP